jgi:hypothetical protein
MRLYPIGALVMLLVGGATTSTTTSDELAHRVADLERLVDAQQTQILILHDLFRDASGLIAANGHRITRLNQATGDFASLTEVLYLNDDGDVVLEGANLRIVNGSGFTDELTGTGNLLIGYDADCDECDTVGSHNIVLGIGNAYLSHSGLLSGTRNTLMGPHSTVLSGDDCTANERAVAIGGAENAALGVGAASLAGRSNTATGADASILGGMEGLSEGVVSVVVGGARNEAKGTGSTVVGGVNGTVTDRFESLP